MDGYEEVSVVDLLLDGQNPRHPSTQTQREAIHALLDDEPNKLVALAKDVIAEGLSPIEIPLVLKSGSRYTVLEGNRRIAILKVLTNPDLAPTPALQMRFKELAATAKIPTSLHCAIVHTREDGRHWIELRHSGERGGAGVVPWGAEASARFAGRRGSQADKALSVIDAVEKAFPANSALQAHLKQVRKDRLTTFGRLISDPSAREAIGIDVSGSDVGVHYPAKEVEKALGRVLHDLANGLTVTDLKTKEQRKRYLAKVADDLPDGSKFSSDARPLKGGPASKTTKTKTKKAPPRSEPVRNILGDVELANLGGKVSLVLAELKTLDVDRYPHACAALLRVVLELAVGQVYDQNNWAEPKDLKAGIKRCLTKIDPGGKADAYAGARAGLQDGTSLLAVKTIQAFLHNPHFHASASEVRSIAANWAPFIGALDKIV